METFGEEISAVACSSKDIAGLLRKMRMMNNYDKWKNHFNEMKGDVGMSVHEKERKQEDAYTKTQNHSYPHPYISVLNLVCLL